MLQNNVRSVHNSHCITTGHSPALLNLHSGHRVHRTVQKKQVSATIFEAGALTLEDLCILYPACPSNKVFRSYTKELETQPAGQQPFAMNQIFPSWEKQPWCFHQLWEGLGSAGVYCFLARHSPQLSISSKPEPFQITIKVPVLEISDHLVSSISFWSFWGRGGGNYVSLRACLWSHTMCTLYTCIIEL